jgi:hypothetical protein
VKSSAIDWAKLAIFVVQLGISFVTWLRERQLLDAGAKEALAGLYRKQLDEMAAADRVLADAAADARRLPPDQPIPDDGFRRD